MINILLIGAPGSGKGTAAACLQSELGICHFSTGDALRAEIKSGSELGQFAAGFMASGRLLPDEKMLQLVAGRLGCLEADCRGLVYDGFPRTLSQAEALDRMLAGRGSRVHGALLLDVEEEILHRRLTARRVCPGCGAIYNVISRPPRREGVCDQCGGALVQRPDDTLETAKRRIAVYEHETLPVIAHYERLGVLLKVAPGSELSNVMPAIRSCMLGLLVRQA